MDKSLRGIVLRRKKHSMTQCFQYADTNSLLPLLARKAKCNYLSLVGPYSAFLFAPTSDLPQYGKDLFEFVAKAHLEGIALVKYMTAYCKVHIDKQTAPSPAPTPSTATHSAVCA
jgi:hypothetical protein